MRGSNKRIKEEFALRKELKRTKEERDLAREDVKALSALLKEAEALRLKETRKIMMTKNSIGKTGSPRPTYSFSPVQKESIMRN